MSKKSQYGGQGRPVEHKLLFLNGLLPAGTVAQSLAGITAIFTAEINRVAGIQQA
jgi:hypothetical protein